MKKLIFVILLLLSLIRSFGQQQTSPAPSITKTDYLQKSKNQKTVAWILLGGGTVMMMTGVVIASEDILDPTPKGGGLVVAGLIVSVASIPFFIASGKKQKEGRVSFI